MRDERRAFVLGLLVALLLARALRALLSSAFYESLATLRLNESAFWTAALAAPLLAALLARRGLLLALLALAVGSAALPFARFTESYLPVAALATGAGLAALPILARHAGGFAGALVGLAFDGALLAFGNSHDPTLTAVGAILAGAAGLAGILLARGLPHAPPARGGLVAGAAIGALVAVEIAFLASPFALARWAGIPAWAATLASLGGLALGAIRGGGWSVWILGALGLLDLALIQSPIRALSILALQAALGAAGARLAPGLGGRAGAVGFALVLAPLLFVLLFFRSPLGLSEWGLLVPAMALAALFPALRAPRPPRSGHAIVAIALAALAIGSAIPAPLAEAPEGREITVVTWNIHQGFGNRGALDPQIYADVLRDLDADLILLQESDTARLSSGGLDVVRYLADELDLRAAYGRGGPAILSRFPFAHEPMRDEEWLFEAAILVDNTTVWVESVHFGRSGTLRADQAAEVVAAPGAPRIVAGDFNLFGGATPYATLTSRYADAWVETGHDPTDPAGRTFRMPNPSIRIDLVLLDGLDAISAERLLDERTRLASDHLPVIARVRVPE